MTVSGVVVFKCGEHGIKKQDDYNCFCAAATSAHAVAATVDCWMERERERERGRCRENLKKSVLQPKKVLIFISARQVSAAPSMNPPKEATFSYKNAGSEPTMFD